MYVNLVPMRVLLTREFYADEMCSIVQGDTKVGFFKQEECIENRIMTRSDHYFPKEIAGLIAFFANEDIVYFSISIDVRTISDVCAFSADFLELVDRYWINPVTLAPPALVLCPQDVDDKLFPWQRSIIKALLRTPRYHKDPLHVVHGAQTGRSFTRSGYMIQGDGTGLPLTPTTGISGCLVIGRYAVGKRYAVLQALAEAKSQTCAHLHHPGRTFSRAMVIVTTSEKIAAWKRELERRTDWTIVYVDTWECLRDKMYLLPTADLILVNRRAVDYMTRKWLIGNEQQRYLWTTFFKVVVFDDVFGSLVSRAAPKKDVINITREALILKTLFVGHSNILVASNIHDGQDPCRSNNFLDLCAFLVGVTTNSVPIYPPALSYLDKIKLDEKVFGSTSYKFPVADESKASFSQHFLSHHVLVMEGHEATEPELLSLKYHHLSSHFLETHTTISPAEIRTMNNIIDFHRLSISSSQAALVKVIVHILSQENTEVAIYRRDKGSSFKDIRGLLMTHGIELGNDRFRDDLKRKRCDGKEYKSVVILHSDNGEETCLRSVTHIIAIGGDSHALRGEFNFVTFIERATRYGLMNSKPVTLIKLVENRI